MGEMRRVVILGRGGAGKSVLARQLSELTGLPAIELDRLFWQPGPVPAQAGRGWAGTRSRRRKTSQALVDRSRVILACAEGGTISCVAAELGVSRDMVSKWRARFLEKRLAGATRSSCGS
jgi:shikimate kinase